MPILEMVSDPEGNNVSVEKFLSSGLVVYIEYSQEIPLVDIYPDNIEHAFRNLDNFEQASMDLPLLKTIHFILILRHFLVPVFFFKFFFEPNQPFLAQEHITLLIFHMGFCDN